MRIDTQGWDFWYIAKRLFLIGVAGLVAYWLFKPGAPDKPRASLDYTKPIYTTGSAIICPRAVLDDVREGYGPPAVMDMYTSPFTYKSKAEKLGCTVLSGGVPITSAAPMKNAEPFVEINESDLTVEADLTNDPGGHVRYVDSNTAQTSSSAPASTTTGETFDASKTYINTAPTPPTPLSNSSGMLLVSSPSNAPILKGDVEAGNLHGVGATICPDTRTFAAFMDGIDESNKKTALDSMRRCGCSYFPPDTPMVSNGANEFNSLVVVNVKTPDGKVIEGVTLPSSIVQAQPEDQPTKAQSPTQ